MKVKSTEFSYDLFLNASRRTESGVHSNTWNIVAVISCDCASVKPEDMYAKLESALEYYQNKILDDTVPFDFLEPNLVNLSNYFSERFGGVAAAFGGMLTELRVNDSAKLGIVLRIADR